MDDPPLNLMQYLWLIEEVVRADVFTLAFFALIFNVVGNCIEKQTHNDSRLPKTAAAFAFLVFCISRFIANRPEGGELLVVLLYGALVAATTNGILRTAMPLLRAVSYVFRCICVWVGDLVTWVRYRHRR